MIENGWGRIVWRASTISYDPNECERRPQQSEAEITAKQVSQESYMWDVGVYEKNNNVYIEN